MTEVLGLPRIAPMLATPGSMPPPGEQRRWAFEMKWDGVRAVAYVADGRLVVLGRSGRDITGVYPELAGVAGTLVDRRCVLDGEIVAFDAQGRPSFETLQARMHGVRRGRAAARDVPSVACFVFDVLHLDGVSLLDQPYAHRRRVLQTLDLDDPHWVVPPVFEGTGAAALETSARQQLEGIVAKRLDARYEPGRRSPAWVKIKHLRTQEVVIGGWRLGTGARATTFGSLLCGVHEGGRLLYVGRVGTGFTQERLAALADLLAGLARATSPFDDVVPVADTRDARWVEPRLVGEVAFASWTREGRLWHPTWRGLRLDKDPAEVVCEENPP
jgi:bifunctional non-homologous end joining protein LigD